MVIRPAAKDEQLDALPRAAYTTKFGTMLQGNAEDVIASDLLQDARGRVSLIFTSPPFLLNRKKKYGNRQGSEYIDWLCSFGADFLNLLTPEGSIVIELGNSWEPGLPVMSTIALKALLEFQERNGLYLCQEFIWNNPAKLPTPAAWVNIKRVRVKDSFTRLWWLSPTPNPKASNLRVLNEYSDSMKQLLANQKYNPGLRPSEHRISSDGFLKDRGGAIPSNVLNHANTASSGMYQTYCRTHGLKPHPARMPSEVAKFFIKFLTEPGDLVLDPFAGSNTTGAVAESLGRFWRSIEPRSEYVDGSRGRFPEDAFIDSNEESTSHDSKG